MNDEATWIHIDEERSAVDRLASSQPIWQLEIQPNKLMLYANTNKNTFNVKPFSVTACIDFGNNDLIFEKVVSIDFLQ